MELIARIAKQLTSTCEDDVEEALSLAAALFEKTAWARKGVRGQTIARSCGWPLVVRNFKAPRKGVESLKALIVDFVKSGNIRHLPSALYALGSLEDTTLKKLFVNYLQCYLQSDLLIIHACLFSLQHMGADRKGIIRGMTSSEDVANRERAKRFLRWSSKLDE